MPGGFGSAYKGGAPAAPTASGGGFGSNWSGAATSAPSKSGGGGLLGWLGSKADLAGKDIVGMGTGLVKLGEDSGQALYNTYRHPLRVPTTKNDPLSRDLVGMGKQTVQSVEHPLRDPFQTGLNAVALLTGGAGLAAKAGSTAAKLGMISDTSKLANLGKATDLTVPDFAKNAGQSGEDIVVKRSAANPVVRARQTAVNKGLNKLPHQTPVLGSSARAVKALAKEPARAAARMTIEQQQFAQDFGKLTSAEKAAWHLKGQGVHDPVEYKTFLQQQKDASPGMLKLLDSPKVKAAFGKPSPRLNAALSSGRQLSQHLTDMRVAAGHISDTTAAESPYRLLKLVYPEKSTEDLAKGLAAKGHEQPFYVPHSDRVSGSRGVYTNRPPAGFSAPAPSGALKKSEGILARKGQLAFNENPLLHEWTKQRGFTEAQQLHDALVEHAAELPKGQALPNGYEYLKLNRGEAAAPHTEQTGGKFEHAMDPTSLFTRNEKDTQIAESSDGNHRLVVPSEVKRILTGRVTKTPGALYRLLYQQPSSLWKHLIVGLRPASAVNINVGNSILGALQMAPRHGIESWLNQVARKSGRVTDATVNDVFPEQKLGTFGRSVSGTNQTALSRAAHEKLPRTTAAAGKLYQGVMPATIRYENMLRRAMIEGWARHTPEVQAAMKTHGGDINAALRDVSKSHPQIINEISKRTDDALGDYHSYNGIERQIRQLVPFYGWDRHVVRSVGRILGERPVKAAVGTSIGHLGNQTQQQTLGELPSFLGSGVKLSGLPGFMGPMNGRTAVWDPGSLFPFKTAADIAGMPFGGQGSSDVISSINPILQSAIEQLTGTSLLSGAPLPKKVVGHNLIGKLEKTVENTVTGVPQVALAKTALEGTQSKPQSLYQNDWQTMLSALLGAKIKKTDLNVAHAEARKGR